jgi:hypothetical protein
MLRGRLWPGFCILSNRCFNLLPAAAVESIWLTVEGMAMKTGANSIELKKGGAAKVFVIVVRGKLGKEDYEEFVPQLEWQIAKEGKINLLLELVAFRGWTLHGLWQEIKFAAKHFNEIRKIAVIGGGNPWEHGMTALSKPFTRAQVRFFRAHEKDTALRWTQNGLLV